MTAVIELAAARKLSPMEKARLVLEIAGLYTRIRRSLRHGDLETTVQGLRASGAPATGWPPDVDVRLANAVERTLGWVPRSSRCLVQSLVLVGLLARRGLDSVLVIGVTPAGDFAAHAWVERDGHPLLPAGLFGRLAEL